MYLLLDENNIVRCLASEECNLHKDKIAADMEMVEANYGGIVGDKYFPEEDRWEKHPENYPQPTEEEINEAKILAKMRELAVEALKKDGELPPGYQKEIIVNHEKD